MSRTYAAAMLNTGTLELVDLGSAFAVHRSRRLSLLPSDGVDVLAQSQFPQPGQLGAVDAGTVDIASASLG